MVSSATMASGTQRNDEVRVARTSGLRRDVVALVVVCVGLAVGAWLLRPGRAAVDGPVDGAPPPVAAGVPVEAPDRRTERAPATPENPPRTRAAKLRALHAAGIRHERGPDGKPSLDAAPVIDALNRAGVHEGIAAFPPPGTDPPKEGVVVPDDFPLPEGYVRHYQTTDDGEALPPILMFHPDYDFVDDAGNPVAIPPDRVVPPELVPPGFPVKTLQIPSRTR